MVVSPQSVWRPTCIFDCLVTQQAHVTRIDAVVGVSMEDAGRVYIDWGPGTRAWVQRAQEKPKPILEVTRIFQEEAFPGYTAFIANLSAIEALPSNWLAALRAARG